jgi:hypothetical protein
VYDPAAMSAVNGMVSDDLNWLEHLSIPQFGPDMTPAWATSITNVCGALSALTRFNVIESPCVTDIVGPGLLPFQPVAKLPVNMIVRDAA